MNSLPEEVRLDDVMPQILELLGKGQSVQLYPRGVSMMPMLRQGIDSVVLSPIEGKLKKYDLPFYRRRDGQYVLHRIVKVGDRYTCCGDNQFAYEHNVRQEQLIAVVTGFYRDEAYYPVTCFRYKCYCRLWHWTRFTRHVYRWLCAKFKKVG